MNNKIILIGMKGCGKSTVGKLLADKLDLPFIELDNELEQEHKKLKKETLTFRDIYKKYGNKYFRKLETEILVKLSKILLNKDFVLTCGGGTPLIKKNQTLLKKLGIIVYLSPDKNIIYGRIIQQGVPAYFSEPDNPRISFEQIYKEREPIYSKLADRIIKFSRESAEEVADKVIK